MIKGASGAENGLRTLRRVRKKSAVAGRKRPCQTPCRVENRRKPPLLTMNLKPNGKSRFEQIAGTAFLKEFTFAATVSIPRVLMKRFLLSDIASCHENGSHQYLSSKDEFIANLSFFVKSFGTDVLSEPDRPKCFKVPGGYEALLKETMGHWDRLFRDDPEPVHLIRIEFSIRLNDLVVAYAYAMEIGLIDTEVDAKGCCNPTEIISAVLRLYLRHGASGMELATVEDVYLSNAKSTIKENFKCFFESFSFESSVDFNALDF
jgi:hypothetical protein